VEIVDAKGRRVPTADNLVQFSVAGAGEVRGVGNGDPSSHETDKASRRSAFNGLCMVLVGAKEKAGPIVLKATSPGLRTATLPLLSSASGQMEFKSAVSVDRPLGPPEPGRESDAERRREREREREKERERERERERGGKRETDGERRREQKRERERDGK
jgi:hypothetical protein